MIKLSLKFVPKGPIDNNTALVHIMTWVQNRPQAIIWNNADLIHWCIYAALEGDEDNPSSAILNYLV